jgi:hypothetical protein
MFVLALSAFLLAAPARAADPCPADPGCGNFTLPSWSDGAGWTASGRWDTILYADLDGDGQVELLGRSADGLEVWQFHAADGTCEGPGTGCGRWEHVATSTDFADGRRQGRPLVAASIRAAKLYGTAAEQIFVWDQDGIVVYSWDSSQKQLVYTDLVDQFESRGSSRGDEPRYLETLQTVSWLPESSGVVKGSLNIAMRDVNNNGQILVAGYCGGSAGWCKSAVLNGFDNSTRFGTEAFAWRTIRFGDIDGDGKADVWGSDGLNLVWEKNDGASGAPQPDYVFPAGNTDWGLPAHYLTMIQGNYYPGRGAGGVQILMRGSDTLRILFYEGGALKELFSSIEADSGTPLHDRSLDPTEYSGTWQAVDVDGDGASEIVMRTPGGVRIYKLNLALVPNKFSEITSPGFANSEAFAGETRARTIRMVRSGGGFLLIGRSGIGIMTGRWVSGTVQNNGRFEKVSAGYPQFTGTAALAYGAINTQLGLLGKEIRSFYSGRQGDLNNYRTTLLSTVKNPGLDPAVWASVYNQVNRELTWASFAAGMFGANGFNASIINESFLSTDLTATELVRRLDLDLSRVQAQEQSEKQMVVNLTANVVQLIGLSGAKGISLALSIFNTVVGAIHAGSNNLPAAIADFDLRLATLFNDAIVANSLAQIEIAGDYGLLAEVGSLIQAGLIPSDATTQDQLLAASRFSMERMLW